MLKLTAVALLVLAAAPKGKAGAPAASADPCSPERLKLGEVKKLIAFDLPKDCKPRPPAMRVLVRSEKDFGERMTCDKKAVAGVDFKKVMLVAWIKDVAPNTQGHDIWDEEGRKVTVVARQKQVCPEDPRVEPSKQTVAFLTDTDPVPPEFGESACTVPAQCKP
jgi:hypothetical protein